jgi:hypothetical protein
MSESADVLTSLRAFATARPKLFVATTIKQMPVLDETCELEAV